MFPTIASSAFFLSWLSRPWLIDADRRCIRIDRFKPAERETSPWAHLEYLGRATWQQRPYLTTGVRKIGLRRCRQRNVTYLLLNFGDVDPLGTHRMDFLGTFHLCLSTNAIQAPLACC